MAAKTIAMEQLKQVLKLYKLGKSIKGIVRPMYRTLNSWTKWH
jgi:hypothetical protein